MPKFEIPYRLPQESGGRGAPQTSSLSSTTTYIGLGFCAEATIDLKKVGFYATVAGSGTQTVSLSVETINTADGLPSGTAIVSTTVSLPLTVGWNEVTFSTSGTLSAGTLYMLKIGPMSAAPTTNPTIAYAFSNADESFVPYTVLNGTRQSTRVTECFYLVDNDGGAKYYGWPFWRSSTQGDNQLAVNNSLPQVGMKFRVPTTVCSTYKLLGIKFTGEVSAVTPQIQIAVYDWNSGNTSTALDSVNFSSQASANISNGCAILEYYFDTPPTLDAGSDYIAAIGTSDATSATSPVAVRVFTSVPDATKPALFDQTADYVWDRISRTSTAGSWSTASNQSLVMQLILDVASLPSGGSTATNPLAGYIL